MNKNGLNVYGDYVKKYSSSGFKSGLKYAAYFYIGVTIAGLISPLFLVFGASSLANFLILPLAMLISNPIAWGVIGMIFIVASGVAMGIANPLFHLAKDLINERRTQQEEKSGIEVVNLEGENQERSVTPDSGIGTQEEDKELKKDGQSRASTPDSKNSDVSLDSGHGSDEESKQTQKTEIRTYRTAGDGNNCFFHSVFGSDNSGIYRAEKAQEMRLEWYKFLSQFEHLDDYKMSKPLRSQLQTVFNGFLLKPDDLTGKCDKIKELVAQTNKKINEADDKVKGLKEQIMKKFCDDGDSRSKIYVIIQKEIEQRNIRCPNNQKSVPSIYDLLNDNAKLCNEIQENLKSYALALESLLSEKEYHDTYDPEVIKDSFINNQDLYKAYLEAIKGPYQVFIEEIPILASLAGINIEVHYQNNNNVCVAQVIPESEMLIVYNENLETINYQRNSELWGNKKQETIYLKPGHYERAEIVELEETQSFVGSIVQVFTNALGLINT